MNFMEKEKSKLRKRFCSNMKKQEKTRQLNRQFQQDTRSVYSSFKAMIAEQVSDERPFLPTRVKRTRS